MNLRIIFKVQAIILLINAIGGLFLTTLFLQQAGWNVTPNLITLGQFVGTTFLVFAIWSWRFPDVATENLKSTGMLVAIGNLLFLLIILACIILGGSNFISNYLFRFSFLSLKLLLIPLFILFTSPISSHAISLFAHNSGLKPKAKIKK